MTVESSDRENLALKSYSLDDCKIKDKTERLIHYEAEQGKVYTHLNTEWRFYKSSNDIGWSFINIGLFEVVLHEDNMNQTVIVKTTEGFEIDTELTLEEWEYISEEERCNKVKDCIMSITSVSTYCDGKWLENYDNTTMLF